MCPATNPQRPGNRDEYVATYPFVLAFCWAGLDPVGVVVARGVFAVDWAGCLAGGNSDLFICGLAAVCLPDFFSAVCGYQRLARGAHTEKSRTHTQNGQCQPAGLYRHGGRSEERRVGK